MLLGGFDNVQGASLYFIDYLGSSHKMKFACQGYAGHFLLGLLDKYYKDNMNLEEALQVLRLCFQQLRERFVLNSVNFAIKVVDSNGTRTIQL
jgi:20S proteasome subunit beta 4